MTIGALGTEANGAAPGSVDPSSWLLLCRSVRFGDTDAAGVMHFVRLLEWCHQAYEESLERFGVKSAAIFPTPGGSPAVALPIVHCSADYRAPLVTGDPLAIQLEPRRLDPGCFEVHYRFRRGSGTEARSDREPAAQAITRHVAIDATTRQRCRLPEPISRWLEASSLSGGIPPL